MTSSPAPIRTLALLLVAATLLLGAGPRHRALTLLTGRVVAVSDGDTIVLENGADKVRLRVAGIDCPELHQSYGHQARALTAALTLDRTVTVRVRTHDKYGRTVGEVLLPDGRDLSQELLRAGLAWWYRAHSRSKILRVLEADARAAKRGLWSESDPTPPWTYRHLQPLLR